MDTVPYVTIQQFTHLNAFLIEACTHQFAISKIQYYPLKEICYFLNSYDYCVYYGDAHVDLSLSLFLFEAVM